MKRIHVQIVFLLLIFFPLLVTSQENISISSPTLEEAPTDLGDNIFIGFWILNVALPGYPADSGIEISVALEKVRPTDGAASVYGLGADDWIWSYDEVKNELTGLQNADIGFFYEAKIVIDAIVTEESPDFEIIGFEAEAINIPEGTDVPDDNFVSARTKTISFRNGISGVVFFDENQNGQQDINEYGVQGLSVDIDPVNSSSLTNRNGVFYQEGQAGQTYDMTLNLGSDWILTTNESTISHTYQEDDPANANNNFGVFPVNDISEVFVHIGSNSTICNSNVWYRMRFQNRGTEVINGFVELEKDPLIEFVSAQGNLTIDDDICQWPVVNLFPGETLDYNFVFKMPDESSLGDVIHIPYRFVQNDSGSDLEIFSNVYTSEIVCAFDPNDKTVVPQDDGIETFTAKGQELVYTVRFENTGNANASAVRILDNLDEDLDLTTFNVLNASHFLRTSIDNSSLTFLFDDIRLEPAGQGFVTYSIKPKPGLENYTKIENTANIIFDSNSAIVTNTTVNTLCDATCTTATEELLAYDQLKVYPNPTQGTFLIESDRNMQKVILYSNTGLRVYTSENILQMNRFIQLELDLVAGTYILKVQYEDGVVVRQLIVD